MVRVPVFLFLLSLVVSVGCGAKSTPVAEQSTGAGKTRQSAANLPSPTDVVSQFLDEVRRGGDNSNAQNLLTKRAQTVLAAIGHTVQPIGSPDARFEVTRSEDVPGEQNAALVHSLWREPGDNGMLQDFQVVWAVERESAGWRISGLAIEIAPNQNPQIVDFEDSALMSRLLSGGEETAQSEPGQASQTPVQAAANSSISR
jgi:hypothetical protein